MREIIVSLLASIGPLTCDEIRQRTGCAERSLRKYLYDLRCENRIEGRRVCTNRYWAYRYQIPIPVLIPIMKMHCEHYMWWHPTGTAPEDIKRLAS